MVPRRVYRTANENIRWSLGPVSHDDTNSRPSDLSMESRRFERVCKEYRKSDEESEHVGV